MSELKGISCGVLGTAILFGSLSWLEQTQPDAFGIIAGVIAAAIGIAMATSAVPSEDRG